MKGTVNLRDKLNLISEAWDPKIVGQVNDHAVKLAKFKGEFVMHQHETEDELFLVVEGEIEMRFEDRVEVVQKGEFIIVPKGTPHQPYAKEEASVLLFEPSTTLNTGDVENERTKRDIKHL